MKKFIYLLFALIAFALGGCGSKTQSEVTVLEGNPQLSTYTSLAEDGATVLTGVIQTYSGKVVVDAGLYMGVTADRYTITCINPDNTISVYTTEGKEIGHFEMFTSWAGKYYMGVYYTTRTYYFPTVDEVVTCKNVLTEIEYLILETEKGWEVRTYDGTLLWRIPETFWRIRDAKFKSQFVIVVPNEQHGYQVYSPQGEVVKVLSAKKWQALKKKLSKVIQHSQNVTLCEIGGLSDI